MFEVPISTCTFFVLREWNEYLFGILAAVREKKKLKITGLAWQVSSGVFFVHFNKLCTEIGLEDSFVIFQNFANK